MAGSASRSAMVKVVGLLTRPLICEIVQERGRDSEGWGGGRELP